MEANLFFTTARILLPEFSLREASYRIYVKYVQKTFGMAFYKRLLLKEDRIIANKNNPYLFKRNSAGFAGNTVKMLTVIICT